jgi:hypothetical protein
LFLQSHCGPTDHFYRNLLRYLRSFSLFHRITLGWFAIRVIPLPLRMHSETCNSQ